MTNVYIKPFSVFIYLFDKQQDHVCHLILSLHLKVDTIVSIPVLLQYFFPNFSTFNKERKIKHTTANVRKESMFFFCCFFFLNVKPPMCH